jgi:hypothetical protein
VAQTVEYLPNKHEALSSNPTDKKKKKTCLKHEKYICCRALVAHTCNLTQEQRSGGSQIVLENCLKKTLHKKDWWSDSRRRS